MDTEMDRIERLGMSMDEVDFTSGYETQYSKEYRPLHMGEVSPPDPKQAWYRDLQTIIMVFFLTAVLIFGTILLTSLVFTVNPWKIFVIAAAYLMLAAVYIFLEIKSIHVR